MLSHPVGRCLLLLPPTTRRLPGRLPSSSITASSARPLSTTPPTPRPFRVLGLQQVAIGSLNKAGLSKLWGEVLGVSTTGTFRSDKENVDEDILRIGAPGSPWAVEIDLMQPIDPSKAPKVHVPPLNHIGLWVHPLAAAVEYLTAQGVRFTPGGIRKGAAGHDVCFIHPKGNAAMPVSGEGVLIELVQAPPEVARAYDDAVAAAAAAGKK